MIQVNANGMFYILVGWSFKSFSVPFGPRETFWRAGAFLRESSPRKADSDLGAPIRQRETPLLRSSGGKTGKEVWRKQPVGSYGSPTKQSHTTGQKQFYVFEETDFFLCHVQNIPVVISVKVWNIFIIKCWLM